MPAKRTFTEGQVVVWQREEQGARALRRCQFLGCTPDGRALVGYGANQYNVSLGELSPERGPEPIPFLPGGKIPVYGPPQPLTPAAIATVLEKRRDTLRDAHAAVATASEAVTQAKAVYDRAEREHQQAQSMLLVLDQQQRQNLHGLEEALKAGTPPPELANGLDRSAVVTRAQLAEKALQRFRQELAHASNNLGEARSMVRDAAKAVTAAVIDQQAESYRQRLADLVAERRRLLALASWWPDASGPLKLAPASAEILTAPVDFGGLRVGTDTSAPREWKSLLDRLMTDAEAMYEEAAPVVAAA